MAGNATTGGFLRVGVTGGIGSGKSTVCELFRSLGRHVISADLLARSITDSDGEVKEKIRTAFGEDSYEASGKLNRAHLAATVFSSPQRLRQLNAIVHPAVFKRLEEVLRTLPAETRFPYVAIEAALIFETGYETAMDFTIVVQAVEKIRIARIADRDGLSEPEIRRRMRLQMSPAEKARRADFVIENDGTTADLLPRVHLLDRILTAMAAQER